MSHEKTSIKQLVQIPLDEFKQQVVNYVKSFVQVSSNNINQKPVAHSTEQLNELLKSYSNLQAAISLLKDHQKFQKKINNLQSLIDNYNNHIINISSELSKIERSIESRLYESKPLLTGVNSADVKNSTQKALELSDVLSFGRKLSYVTAAPPGWHQNQMREIPPPFQPPAPQSENMKTGLLFTDIKQLLLGLQQSRQAKLEAEADQSKDKDKDKDKTEVEDAASKPPLSAAKRKLDSESKKLPTPKKMKRQKSTGDVQFNLDISSDEDSD